jgi:hypothetical protein
MTKIPAQGEYHGVTITGGLFQRLALKMGRLGIAQAIGFRGKGR